MKHQKAAKLIFDKLFKKVSYWIGEQSFMLGWKSCLKFLENQSGE